MLTLGLRRRSRYCTVMRARERRCKSHGVSVLSPATRAVPMNRVQKEVRFVRPGRAGTEEAGIQRAHACRQDTHTAAEPQKQVNLFVAFGGSGFLIRGLRF